MVGRSSFLAFRAALGLGLGLLVPREPLELGDAAVDGGPDFSLLLLADPLRDALEHEALAGLAVAADTAAELHEEAVVWRARGDEEIDARAVHRTEVDTSGVLVVDEQHRAGPQLAALRELEIDLLQLLGHLLDGRLLLPGGLVEDETRVRRPLHAVEVLPADGLGGYRLVAHRRDPAVLDREAQVAEQALLLRHDGLERRGSQADHAADLPGVLVEPGVVEDEAVRLVVELDAARLDVPEAHLEVDVGTLLDVRLHVLEGPPILQVEELRGEANDDVLVLAVDGQQVDEAQQSPGLPGAGRLRPDLPLRCGQLLVGTDGDGHLHHARFEVHLRQRLDEVLVRGFELAEHVGSQQVGADEQLDVLLERAGVLPLVDLRHDPVWPPTSAGHRELLAVDGRPGPDGRRRCCGSSGGLAGLAHRLAVVSQSDVLGDALQVGQIVLVLLPELVVKLLSAVGQQLGEVLLDDVLEPLHHALASGRLLPDGLHVRLPLGEQGAGEATSGSGGPA